jgi:hypothetical protein
MMQTSKADEEQLAIVLERDHARRLGVLEDFDEHVREGRFREFLPQLNYLKVQDKHKMERKLYFVAGVAVGFVASLLLTTWY